MTSFRGAASTRCGTFEWVADWEQLSEVRDPDTDPTDRSKLLTVIRVRVSELSIYHRSLYDELGLSEVEGGDLMGWVRKEQDAAGQVLVEIGEKKTKKKTDG